MGGQAGVWRHVGKWACKSVAAGEFVGGKRHLECNQRSPRGLVIWAMSRKTITGNQVRFFFTPCGNWEGFDKTEMTGNGLRIFVDPGSGPFRFAKLPNLGNSSKCSRWPTLGMTLVRVEMSDVSWRSIENNIWDHFIQNHLQKSMPKNMCFVCTNEKLLESTNQTKTTKLYLEIWDWLGLLVKPRIG